MRNLYNSSKRELIPDNGSSHIPAWMYLSLFCKLGMQIESIVFLRSRSIVLLHPSTWHVYNYCTDYTVFYLPAYCTLLSQRVCEVGRGPTAESRIIPEASKHSVNKCFLTVVNPEFICLLPLNLHSTINKAQQHLSWGCGIKN